MVKKADAVLEEKPSTEDVDKEKLAIIEQAGELGLTAAADSLPVTSQPKWLKMVVQKQIKDEIAPKATIGEFGMFIYRCARLGLDPMLKQAYLLPFGKGNDEDELGVRETKHAMIVGIDGFRAKTREQGQYSLQTHWCGEDEVWKDVWLKQHVIKDPNTRTAADATITVPAPPAAARVGLRFDGQTDFTSSIALYSEFCVMMNNKKLKCKVPGPMWMKSPSNQLAKCAEAQTHRKMNGSLLAGVYIREEMENMLLGHAVPAQAGLMASADAGNGEAQQSLAAMQGQPESAVQDVWLKALDNCKTAEDYKKLWDKESPNFSDTAQMRLAHAALGEHRAKRLGGK